MTKEEVWKILESDDSIIIEHMYFVKSGKNGVYINCYPDCNCCMDTFDSFDEFWEIYDYYFKDYIHESKE